MAVEALLPPHPPTDASTAVRRTSFPALHLVPLGQVSNRLAVGLNHSELNIPVLRPKVALLSGLASLVDI